MYFAECLKDLFRKKELGQAGDGPSCIVSVAKIIEVESVDIQVDRGLHEACQLDLAKFCREVSPGDHSNCFKHCNDR